MTSIIFLWTSINIYKYKTFITVEKPSWDGIKIPPTTSLKFFTDFSKIKSNFWIDNGATYHNVLYLPI